MAKLYAVAGSRLHISSDPIEAPDDDIVAADFDAVTWVEVKGWVQMGSFGDSRTVVTSERINSKRVKKAKGTANGGAMENVFDIIPNDPGQLKLIEAEQDANAYGVRIVYDDAPSTGVAPTPSEDMFVALVVSTPRQGGAANDPRRTSSTFEIDSNLVHVPATAGA